MGTADLELKTYGDAQYTAGDASLQSHQKAGVFKSVLNCMNVILGCGIVGLPYALKTIGWVAFTAALVGVASYSLFAEWLLLGALTRHNLTSYEDVAYKAFKMVGKAYTSLVIFMSCMFAMCSYMFIVMYEGPEFIKGVLGIAGTCENAAEELWYLKGNVVVLIVIWLVVAPLCVPKEVDFLGFTSGVGMVSMCGFAVIIILYQGYIDCPIATAPIAAEFLHNFNVSRHTENCTITNVYSKHAEHFYDQHLTQECEAVSLRWGPESVYAVPTVVFAFQFHAGALPIYHELRERTLPNMMRVASIATFAVFLIYGSVSLASYFTFYNLTMEEVLMMYASLNPRDPRILFARAAVLICVIFSAPLLHFTCRKTQIKLFQRPNEEEVFSWVKHLGWALANMVVITVVVMWVEGIKIMFSYGGAVTANSIVIILPAAFYWKLVESQKPKEERSLLYYICPMISAFGIGMMIFMVILINTKGGGADSHADNHTATGTP